MRKRTLAEGWGCANAQHWTFPAGRDWANGSSCSSAWAFPKSGQTFRLTCDARHRQPKKSMPTQPRHLEDISIPGQSRYVTLPGSERPRLATHTTFVAQVMLHGLPVSPIPTGCRKFYIKVRQKDVELFCRIPRIFA